LKHWKATFFRPVGCKLGIPKSVEWLTGKPQKCWAYPSPPQQDTDGDKRRGVTNK